MNAVAFSARSPAFWLNLAVKGALVGLLLFSVSRPDLPQFAGKGMATRALTYPLAALLVPVAWWLVGRRRGRFPAYPYALDILLVLPFLIDTGGNALDLYDSVAWWDDLNHLVNWAILTAACGQLLLRLPVGRLTLAALVVAADAGAVVGMAVGVQGLEDDGAGPPSAGLCFVTMVSVAPDRWGEGIGGRTVDALLAEARSGGYDRAELWTRADNRRARGLYEGRGFRLAGRESADADGERIVLYARRLGDDDVANASDGCLAVPPRAAPKTRPHGR